MVPTLQSPEPDLLQSLQPAVDAVLESVAGKDTTLEAAALAAAVQTKTNISTLLEPVLLVRAMMALRNKAPHTQELVEVKVLPVLASMVEAEQRHQ